MEKTISKYRLGIMCEPCGSVFLARWDQGGTLGDGAILFHMNDHAVCPKCGVMCDRKNTIKIAVQYHRYWLRPWTWLFPILEEVWGR